MLTTQPLLVVGDVMLDHYLIGRVTRISPEAPVPVVNVTEERFVPGGAANVALNLAGLGQRVTLCGASAEDAAGQRLRTLCADQRIETAFLNTATPTISKTRVIGEKQQIVRVDREVPFTAHAAAAAALKDLLGGFEMVVISDYGKGFCAPAVCRACIETVVRVVVDPKGHDWEKYRGAYVVTPNLKELSLVAGRQLPNEDEAIAAAGQQARTAFGFAHLLVTRSERGMTLVGAEGVHHFPTQAIDVFDVSGAGDTVLATLAAFLASGHDLPTAIRWANAAAGYVVSKFGTYALSAEELATLTP